MRAALVSTAFCVSFLIPIGQAAASPHPPARVEPSRIEPGRFAHDPARGPLPALQMPQPPAHLDRSPQLAPLVVPTLPKTEPHPLPETLKHLELPSPEPSPFSNPLHRLLMATISDH